MSRLVIQSEATARCSARFPGQRGLFRWILWSALLFAAHALWAGNYFQGVSPANVFWPGGVVPYLFDTNYSITSTQKNVILAGLREWELAANVQFVPYTNQANHVLLQYTNDGSGSGYCLLGTPATIMLHGLARGLMCHEGGHLLGLQHEHQRVDRYNYIVINTNNIVGGTNGEGAFAIDTNSAAFGPYDLQSVMHYAPGNFSIGPGFDSLDPLPPYGDYYHKLGNLALSLGDRAAVSNLYGPPVVSLTNVVTTTADGGFGSLRAAIYYANDHPGTTIRFNIPGTDPGYSNGVFTIYLVGEPPPLVSPNTAIDGTTQPGYANRPVIVLDGSQVSSEAGSVSGLHFYGTNCTVRALALNNFNYAGLQLLAPDAVSNHVEGCYLGLKPDGTNAAPDNFAGIIFRYGPHNNFIGGLNSTQRNVISGNTYYGIEINDTNSDGNVILGNYIGLDASGSFAIPNGYSGIGVWYDPRSTVIGGTNAGARNVISGNAAYGIYLGGTNNAGVMIQGNYIGTDAGGSNPVANGSGGVGVFEGAHNVTIGGTPAGAGNVLSGNANAGIYFAGVGVNNNLVQGNLIGMNAAGNAALANSQVGIFVYGGASGNTIGGAVGGAANVLSGNALEGVYIGDPGTIDNVVQGNFIGTDLNGTNAVANGDIGVGIWNGTSNNLVGGLIPGAANLISGNTNYGLVIGGATANVVQGNLIGTDVTGTNALANRFTGVGIWGGATSNLIGGAAAGAANVISGNATYGLIISDPSTSGNFVEGNRIGPDFFGREALPNGFAGVGIFNQAAANTIGGTAPGMANFISGNSTYGVFISDTNTSGNLVAGNFIGTDLTGTNALGNGFANVELQSGASGNFIGGLGAGAGNVVAFSGGAGVVLYDPATTNNAVRGNSIFSNGGPGIDFNNDGVTSNHIGFLAGPNDFQNFPVITNACGHAASTIVSGTLNSLADGTFFIDVYRNVVADPSGYGEGQFYVGTVSVITDGFGNAGFALTNNAGNYAGQYLTATATSTGGDTSEFGADVLATNAPAPSAQFTGPLTWQTSGFVLTLEVQTNFTYRLQAATNLASPVVWTDLTNYNAVDSSLTFTDRTVTNYRTRFYRVISP